MLPIQFLMAYEHAKIKAGFAMRSLFLFLNNLQVTFCKMRLRLFLSITPTHVVQLTLFLFGIGYSMGGPLVVCVPSRESTIHIYLTAAPEFERNCLSTIISYESRDGLSGANYDKAVRLWLTGLTAKR